MTQPKRVGDDPKLRRHFEGQAEACEAMDAPFNGRLCRLLAANLDDASALGRRILDWPTDNLRNDLVALRACAGFHALARAGRVSALRDVYPPKTCDDAQLWAALADAIAREDAFLAGYLDSAPQTNELGRSAILLGGVLALAEQVSLPIDLYEVGASAGLNLLFDRWSYDLGPGGFWEPTGSWGPTEAAVRISCPWTGAMPPRDTPFTIRRREASDLQPLDASDNKDRERLLSYIWPDQADRLARTRVALDVAAQSGVTIAKADARGWVARALAPDRAEPGVTSLLFHSVFIQYVDPPIREALVADIKRRGEAATAETPFAWLQMEAGDKQRAHCELRLTVWPGGEERHLAEVDWHGRWAEWRDGAG